MHMTWRQPSTLLRNGSAQRLLLGQKLTSSPERLYRRVDLQRLHQRQETIAQLRSGMKRKLMA
jgi:hypothetical protein